jgi:quinol monooxygenase YgiN
MIERREFIGAGAAGLLAACAPHLAAGGGMEEIYGIIGQMKAVPGKRAQLVAILLEGTRAMPGNPLYLIAEDLADPDSIWITEVWKTRTDHQNSLTLPGVQAAIAKGRSLIAGFGTRTETRPVAYDG